MRILLDEFLPPSMRKWFPGHEVHSVEWVGWKSIRNGNLLSLAEQKYDVLITMDQNMSFQNKISKFNIGVIVIEARNNTAAVLKTKLDGIERALKQIQKSQVIIVGGTDTRS